MILSVFTCVNSFSSFQLQGLLPGFFARRQIEFVEDDLWVNQLQKIDYQKRFPVVQIDSMYQAAIFCRGQVWNFNSEPLQVDWKRETTFH